MVLSVFQFLKKSIVLNVFKRLKLRMESKKKFKKRRNKTKHSLYILMIYNKLIYITFFMHHNQKRPICKKIRKQRKLILPFQKLFIWENYRKEYYFSNHFWMYSNNYYLQMGRLVRRVYAQLLRLHSFEIYSFVALISWWERYRHFCLQLYHHDRKGLSIYWNTYWIFHPISFV